MPDKLKDAGLTGAMLSEIAAEMELSTQEVIEQLVAMDGKLEPPVSVESAIATLKRTSAMAAPLATSYGANGHDAEDSPEGDVEPAAESSSRSKPASRLSNREKIAHLRAARAEGGVTKADLGIVRKPKRIRTKSKVDGFFRTHPDFYEELIIFQPKAEEGPDPDPQYVPDELGAPYIEAEDPAFKQAAARLVQTRGGATFLLVLPLQMGDRPLTSATQQKHEAAEDAVDLWTRMAWKQQSFEYEVSHATKIPAEPDWSSLPRSQDGEIDVDEVIARAFGDNCIWDDDALALRRHRGEA